MQRRAAIYAVLAAAMVLAFLMIGWLSLRSSPEPGRITLPGPVPAAPTDEKPAPAAPPPSPRPGTANDPRRMTPEAREAMIRSLADARTRRQQSTPRPMNNGVPEQQPLVGSLDKDYVRARVKEIIPLLQECYVNALREHPGIGGRMEVQFAIVAEESVGGLVESSEVKETSTLRDPSMVECVRETMYALRMQAPKGGGRVVVNYPFLFANEAPDGG